MEGRPKKTKALPPVRPELIEPLTEIVRDRGLEISGWPADEAAAYRDNGRFLERREAVQQLRIARPLQSSRRSSLSSLRRLS